MPVKKSPTKIDSNTVKNWENHNMQRNLSQIPLLQNSHIFPDFKGNFVSRFIDKL